MRKITRELIEEFRRFLAPCRLCPRECGVDRLAGEKGKCGAGRDIKVAFYNQHFGEESSLVGRFGSGTVFLSHCNLACVFCQNYDLSHGGLGRAQTPEGLGRMMLELQELGCHNVNFVTPTPWVPWIVEALAFAQAGGLRIPVVYNTGGYDSLLVIKLLAGIVDIYMPDLKYGSNAAGEKYSGVPDYWDRARIVFKEMQSQVGDLQVAEGIARRGLLIRHLILPDDRAESRSCLEFIAREISPRATVNVMDQYRPAGRAGAYPEINRRITVAEYRRATRIRDELGLYPG
jgi:putative pyruvate formate lyase activating enzyme